MTHARDAILVAAVDRLKNIGTPTPPWNGGAWVWGTGTGERAFRVERFQTPAALMLGQQGIRVVELEETKSAEVLAGLRRIIQAELRIVIRAVVTGVDGGEKLARVLHDIELAMSERTDIGGGHLRPFGIAYCLDFMPVRNETVIPNEDIGAAPPIIDAQYMATYRYWHDDPATGAP